MLHMKLYRIFLLTLLIAILSCSKDPVNNNNNNNNNTTYNNSCPKGGNNYCILSSSNLSYTIVNSGIHPLTAKLRFEKTTSSTGTLNYRAPYNKYVGSGIEFRYKYETGNNCNEFILRQSPSEFNILRTINFIANDSFAIMKDSILCPDNGCFLVNDKYLNNYLNNKDKNDCQKVTIFPYLRLCACGLKNSGNKCQSENKSFEIDNISRVGSSFTNGMDTYILNEINSKIEIIKLDRDKVVWRVDISSLFVNKSIADTDNYENFSILSNGNIVFGGIIRNGPNTSNVILLEINSLNGEIVKQKKYSINQLVNEFGTTIMKMNNNEYIMEIKEIDHYVIFDSNLQLSVIKKRATLNDGTLNTVPNNVYSDGNFVYKLYYKVGVGNKYEIKIYKYSNRMDLEGISTYNPEGILKYERGYFYTKLIELSDKSIVLIKQTDNFGESGYEWHRIKPDGGKISKGIIFGNENNLNSIKALLDGNKLYFVFEDYFSMVVAKSDSNTGKTEFVYVFTPETSFNVETIKEVFKENNFISIITTGIHSRKNILKFKFTEESLYKYDICN